MGMSKQGGLESGIMKSSLPNVLTGFRIAIIPVLVGALFAGGDAGRWMALFLFAVAAVTDFFDGYAARRMGSLSRLGQMLDPIADKLLITAALVMLVAQGPITGIHVVAVIIILLREVLISGLREFLSGQQVVVAVTTVAKWKTTIQMIATGILLLGPAGDRIFWGLTDIGLTLLWVAALITAYTGFEYLRGARSHFMDSPSTDQQGLSS